MKLLLVEDEAQLSDSITTFLKLEEYLCETAKNYTEAHEKINLHEYDCILVDIGLPDGNGLEILKTLKKNKTRSGIIIISAKNSLEDKIMGLDLGADDYIAKPFHLAELNSRIKSILRRRKFEGQTEVRYNEIVIRPEAQACSVDGEKLELTKKEYELLIFFICNKNRLLTKESIDGHL